MTFTVKIMVFSFQYFVILVPKHGNQVRVCGDWNGTGDRSERGI